MRQFVMRLWRWIASRVQGISQKVVSVALFLIKARPVRARWIIVSTWRALKFVGGALVLVALTLLFGNWIFNSPRDVPYRALSKDAPPCKEGADQGWDTLASTQNGQIANDELSAIERKGLVWQAKFACVIQHHVIPGYVASDGKTRKLDYQLAFLEFQEDGKPYALRELCERQDKQDCNDEGYGPVKISGESQLDAVLTSISSPGPHYVMIFVHGWRNDASIGNSNLADFRLYAAHVARFLEDRALLDPNTRKPQLTAIYVGWRGARIDETWLHRQFGVLGDWVGSFFAVGTLFDRKPVSEAIAPSVLSAFHAIEARLSLSRPIPDADYVPNNKNHMIVFGHSLGGNLLITALKDDLVKRVVGHQGGKYVQPVLGDLVVLINPAAEAAKWIEVQRAVWLKLAMFSTDRRPLSEYAQARLFFRQDQVPIIVSATNAIDWPPGGYNETDCPGLRPNERTLSRELSRSFDYDWATYDLFPFFKGDFRPLADSLQRIALQRDPHNACDDTPVSWSRWVFMSPVYVLGYFLRVFPFMNTNPEESRALGHLDPPRGPRGMISLSGRHFGTTHALFGFELPHQGRTKRKYDKDGIREIPLSYMNVTLPEAGCPVAKAWLLKTRQKTVSAQNLSGANWYTDETDPGAPALMFVHGFGAVSRLLPITHANDPFWNMRAFDTALARHDGYLLSSFICAMNQLVMDNPGGHPE